MIPRASEPMFTVALALLIGIGTVSALIAPVIAGLLK